MKCRRTQLHSLICVLTLVLALANCNEDDSCPTCAEEIEDDDEEEEEIEEPEFEESDNNEEAGTEWSPNALQDFAISMPSLYRLVVEEQYLYRVLKKYLIKHKDDYEDLDTEDIYHGIQRC